MDDLISRANLLKALAGLIPYGIAASGAAEFSNGLHAAYVCVKEVPTVPAEVVRHGEMADEIERLQAELDAANDLVSRAAVWLELHKSEGIEDVLREFARHLAAMKEDAHESHT
jgi:hypothetical protein